MERTNYPLTAAVIPGDSLTLKLNFDGIRFGHAEAATLLDRWIALLAAMPETPDAIVDGLTGLNAADTSRLIAAANPAGLGAAEPVAAHRLVERIARRYPDAPALDGGGTVLHGPTEVPGGAFIAVCTDPQGAWFTLVGPKEVTA